MKCANRFLIAILSLALLYSCGTAKKAQGKTEKIDPAKLAPLTGTIVKDFDLIPPKLQRAQFFLGPVPVILERAITDRGSEIDKIGRIILKNTQASDKIVIDPYTPGTCIPGGIDSYGLIKISFVEGNNNLFLTFVPDRSDLDHTYILYVMETKDTIFYGKNLYQITSGAGVSLYFNPEEFNGNGKFRKEKGRLISRTGNY